MVCLCGQFEIESIIYVGSATARVFMLLLGMVLWKITACVCDFSRKIIPLQIDAQFVMLYNYGVGFLITHTPSRRGSPRTPTYLPCSIRARVASDMIVGQVRGSSLTLTIANPSWHAVEVSIQETPPWPYGEASQPRLWEAKPSSLAACGSRASHRNERQMLGGSSSQDLEA